MSLMCGGSMFPASLMHSFLCRDCSPAALALGDEGSEQVRSDIKAMAPNHGDDVLQISIPLRVKRLLEERSEQEQYHAEDLAMQREEHLREVDRLTRRADEAAESEEHAWQEWERMKLEVSEAQAREAALRELLEGMLRK